MAQLILGATAQTSALQRVTNATNEPSPPKKPGSPHDQNTTGIVPGDPSGTEFAAAYEIATLIATGQETGPHSEVALCVAPMVAMVGDGGLQKIRDVLTLAEADMSIVPVALLNRARAVLGLGDGRKPDGKSIPFPPSRPDDMGGNQIPFPPSRPEMPTPASRPDEPIPPSHPTSLDYGELDASVREINITDRDFASGKSAKMPGN